MMMVILQHIALYGGWPPGLDQTFDLAFNSMFIQFVYHFGKIGVWIFVLITGYYMVNSKSPVLPKFLRLWLQVLSTSVIIDVAFIILAGVPFDSINWKVDLFPVSSGMWWFASAYLISLPFIPFVNRLLTKLDRCEHLTLILLMVLAWSVIPSFKYSDMFGSVIILFFMVYTIGAYIRLHPESFEKNAAHYGLCTLALILLLAVMVIIINLVGPVPTWKPLGSTIVWGNDSSIMVVLIAIFTFLTFRRLNIGRIWWINMVAATTFGIYLIQEHHLFRQWLFGFLDMGSHYESSDLVLYVVLCTFFIFILCAILELLRMKMMDPVVSRVVPVITRVIYRVQNRLVGGGSAEER